MASFKPNFATFLKFAKVELTPPSPGDIPAISRGIGELMSAAKSGKWKHLTVKVSMTFLLWIKLTVIVNYSFLLNTQFFFTKPNTKDNFVV